MSQPEVNREELATVLGLIADDSPDDLIRDHLRQVTDALRGNGLIIINGPSIPVIR